MDGAVQRRDLRIRLFNRQEVPRLLHTVTRARIRSKKGIIMNRLKTLSATALFLLLGLAVPAHARQEKPEKQEEGAKPPKQEQQAKPQKQDQAKQQKQEKQQEAKSQKQEQQKSQQQAKGQQEQQQKQQRQEAKSQKQE